MIVTERKHNDIIASWICIDDASTASYFPSSKGSSSSKNIQEIYWKCLCVFFAHARFFNPESRLILFSNTAEFPKIEGKNLRDLLQKWNVECLLTPFNYVPPKTYYGNWRNQFFEFSIFETIISNMSFNSGDRFLLLDSDCIVKGKLDSLFNDISEHRLVAYHYHYPENYVVNGISRRDMRDIYEELLNRSIQEAPPYYGGEFFAATLDVVKKISADFQSLWPILLQRSESNLLKFNEEAHVLSFLFYKNELGELSLGNKYIKRLWTDPTSFRNVDIEDRDLLIWHLPAEKRTGFKSVFEILKNNDFEISNMKLSGKKYIDVLGTIFSVPKISKRNNIYFTLKNIGKSILKNAK